MRWSLSIAQLFSKNFFPIYLVFYTMQSIILIEKKERQVSEGD